MNIPPETCCGCSACAAVCQVKAIKMKENPKGFYVPQVDLASCIGCGLCSKTCPELSNTNTSNKPLLAKAIRINSDSDRIQSTSGGAFTVLSDCIIAQGGIVFGTVFDKSFRAVIKGADNVSLRNQMRGSKYVESDVGNSFIECADVLKSGKSVLFTGTPCQIAGLVKFLKNIHASLDYLYTCQIICHGTPSPMVFRDHLANLKSKRNKEIDNYYHRPKIWGWHEHNEMVCFCGGKNESQSKISQNHKDLFYSGYSLRESCFQCQYAGNPGYADFTIGDFWGVEFIAPELDDNKGISILLINTEKGNELFKTVSSNTFLSKDIDIDKALKYNHTKPSKKPQDYEQFWSDYKQLNFSQIASKYANDKMPNNIVYMAKKWLRRVLVKMHIIGH